MCNCTVNRLSDKEGEPPNRFILELRVECSECKLPFRFIGLPAGLDLNGAAVSADAQEARLAMAPKGAVVSASEEAPFGFSIRASGPKSDNSNLEFAKRTGEVYFRLLTMMDQSRGTLSMKSVKNHVTFIWEVMHRGALRTREVNCARTMIVNNDMTQLLLKINAQLTHPD